MSLSTKREKKKNNKPNVTFQSKLNALTKASEDIRNSEIKNKKIKRGRSQMRIYWTQKKKMKEKDTVILEINCPRENIVK